MEYEKVFISYSSKDRLWVDALLASVSLILNPCVSEDINKAGEPLNKKVRDDIESSNVVVPILTASSMSSTWVNQELGYALRWQVENGGEPLILPVCEEGLHPSGFITKKDTEMIPIFVADIDETTYRLIGRLRGYIDRNWVILDKVKVLCENCRNIFKIDLPEQKVIDGAVRSKKLITAHHNACGTMNMLNPRTLKVVSSTRVADARDGEMAVSPKVGSFSGTVSNASP